MPANLLAQVQTNDIARDEYFAKRILEMIKLETSQFVFTTLGRKVDIPKNHGTKTIRLRRYNSLPVDLTVDGQGLPLTEGTAPASLKVAGTVVDGTISQYGAYIEETDWVNEIHMDDVKTTYQPELARHAAEVLERVVLNSFSDASEYFIGDIINGGRALADASEYSALATNAVISLVELRKVALTMKNYRRKGHSKFGGKPVTVMHPNVMEDLLDDSDLVDKLLTPGNDNTPIKNGSLQQYKAYGMHFVETLIADVAVSYTVKTNGTYANAAAVAGASSLTAGDVHLCSDGTYQFVETAVDEANVLIVVGAPANVYTSYMLGREPYVVIGLGSGKISWHMTGFKAEKTDPLAQKATFGYKMWAGAKVIDPFTITRIHTLSSYDIVADFSGDTQGSTVSQA